MRSLVVLHGFVALVAAQLETFSIGPLPTREPTSIINIEPSATATEAGPISTGRACAQIGNYVRRTRDLFPAVEAELAYACLKSVPIDKDSASLTINSIKRMVQFQSTLTYLKKPPPGYPNEGVDILTGLDDIDRKINNGDYENEYDFEIDISLLLGKARDGHLTFDGMASTGVFMWSRDPRIWLISSSEDGKETPKIWAVTDVNGTAGQFTPSAITEIDGKDVVQFLEEESELASFHDPDVRFNSMFLIPSGAHPGSFALTTTKYPSPSTTVTFENGTTQEYPNIALVLDYEAWSVVDDSQSFYNEFVRLRPITSRLAKRKTPTTIPRKLRPLKGADPGGNAILRLPGYPEPVIEHSDSLGQLAGYSVPTTIGTVGVLAIQTFDADQRSDIEEFQQVIQDYISQAKEQGITKHIIDLRMNGGGLVMLGYDAYLQFFPSQKPQLLSRQRATDANDILGEQISKLDFTSWTMGLYGTPFNVHSYVDKDLEAFDSWKDMYGPTTFNDDSFTNLLRYNLSDPLVSSSSRFSIGITMTGYGDRSEFTEDPFKKEDIVLLLDGWCASTCSLFTELMVQQSDVRTIVVGGRPSPGPMQAVGGTKGSLVYSYEQLHSVSTAVVQLFASSASEERDWVDTLPLYGGINYNDASVNMQDNIREGFEKDGIPTQFLNDSASCRIWYESEDYFNVTRLWSKVAAVAFGGEDGGLEEGACVAGSVTNREAQRGLGEGSPISPGGAPQPSKSKAAAVTAIKPVRDDWKMVLVCGTMVLGFFMMGAALV